MSEFSLDRRALLRGLAGAGGAAALPGVGGTEVPDEPRTDPHTRVTFAAAVDAVVPRTPELDHLGEEHVPGGLQAGLERYFVTYVNDLFSNPKPAGESDRDMRLAEPVAGVLDEAATELLARGENERPPSLSQVRDLLNRSATLAEAVDAAAAGPFARLARRDRVRALSLFDEERKEFDTAALPGPVVESDAGIVPNLVVAFAAVIYYSEWQGYEDFTVAPSEREFLGEGAVQSWRQTDFPGFADGYAAFRGYWGDEDSPLGEGDVWKDEGDKAIYFESGEFAENDYDTADYEEPFPEADDGGASLSAGTTADGGGAW